MPAYRAGRARIPAGSDRGTEVPPSYPTAMTTATKSMTPPCGGLDTQRLPSQANPWSGRPTCPGQTDHGPVLVLPQVPGHFLRAHRTNPPDLPGNVDFSGYGNYGRGKSALETWSMRRGGALYTTNLKDR